MRKQRNHYDKTFKENTVKLSFERKNVSELVQELGVEPFMLYRWRKEFQNNGPLSFPGNGVHIPEHIDSSSNRVVLLSGI